MKRAAWYVVIATLILLLSLAALALCVPPMSERSNVEVAR